MTPVPTLHKFGYPFIIRWKAKEDELNQFHISNSYRGRRKIIKPKLLEDRIINDEGFQKFMIYLKQKDNTLYKDLIKEGNDLIGFKMDQNYY